MLTERLTRNRLAAGTIDVGKAADQLLLDASPLGSIGNTKRVAAVVSRARLLPRTELDQMSSEAERVATLKSLSESLLRTIETNGIAAAVARYRDLKANARNSLTPRSGPRSQITAPCV